jgi:hypothetical protein
VIDRVHLVFAHQPRQQPHVEQVALHMGAEAAQFRRQRMQIHGQDLIGGIPGKVAQKRLTYFAAGAGDENDSFAHGAPFPFP